MFIVWGSGLYGKTDEIPGLGYVATKFGHLYYLPLFPSGSNFVIEKTSDGWQGAPIRFSGKSFMMAWLRALLLIGSLISVIVFLVTAGDPGGRGVVGAPIAAGIACLGCLGAWFATTRMKLFTQASYERALQIADEVGFSDEARVIIDFVYERITQQEADRRFDALGEDGQDAFAGQDAFTMHQDE